MSFLNLLAKSLPLLLPRYLRQCVNQAAISYFKPKETTKRESVGLQCISFLVLYSFSLAIPSRPGTPPQDQNLSIHNFLLNGDDKLQLV